MDNSKSDYQKRENFHVYLKLMGYTVHRSLPDNNCLYDCIAAAVSNFYGDYWEKLSSDERLVKQQTVRDDVYNHMTNHKKRFKDYFSVKAVDVMSKDELDKAKENQIEFVNAVGHWGGKGSIYACSEVYKKRVIVERLQGGRLDTGPKDNDDIIYLASFGKKHYNLLTKQLNQQEPDRDIVSLYFEKALRLKGLEYVYQNDCNDSVLDALSVAFTNKDANTDTFKENLKIWIEKNITKVTQKYLERMRENHPKDFCSTEQQRVEQDQQGDEQDQQGDEQVQQGDEQDQQGDEQDQQGDEQDKQGDEQDQKDKHDVKNFVVNKLLVEPAIDEELLILFAVDTYEKNVIVYRPLDPDIVYEFNKDARTDTVHLALDQGHLYSVLKLSTSQEEQDDDVTFIDPKEQEGVLDNIEHSFIMSNVLRNVRTKVTVVFFVPGQLNEESLADALRVKPSIIRHIVVYTSQDLNNLKTDKELRQVCTLYAKTFTMPMNLDLTQRLQRLASFLIPPLFLSICNKTIWRGVRYDVYTKYSKTCFAYILLTYLWSAITTNVMADVNKLVNSEVDLLCNECNPECELASVQSHYDATMFLKMDWEPESSTGFLDGYTEFKYVHEEMPKVMRHIQQLYDTPDSLNSTYLCTYLDKNSRKLCRVWTTYFVLHLDGPNMDKYPKDTDNYYVMLKDPSVIKSVYVGKTTDSVFRFSHFVSTTSLNQVFTKTSRLFMLRSEKFPDPHLAEQDEAMVIEIITAWMKSWSKRRKKANILFLNQQAQPTPLLSVFNKDDPKMWAEFAASDIHILNFSPDNKNKFEKYKKFQGNFSQLYELNCVEGNFVNRSFRNLDRVYRYIRFRQP